MAQAIIRSKKKNVKIPLVSVVMSVYNGEKYLREAIDSILNQTFKDFEFIIINDGSTDDTLKIIKSYKDPRIMLTSRENKGLVASLNEGIERARGKYIARMDADDISVSERLQLQVEYLESNPCVGLVGSQFCTINKDDSVAKSLVSMPITDYDIKLLLGYGTVFCHSSVLFKKELIGKVGGYDEKYYLAEDHDLWCRMAEVTKVHNIPEVLLAYRLVDSGISSGNSKLQVQRMKAVSKKWRKVYAGTLDISSPSKMLYVIWRYRRLRRSLKGYTLKPYLDELINVVADDIRRNYLNVSFILFKKACLKVNKGILRYYG